jgi:VanZ family protein
MVTKYFKLIAWSLVIAYLCFAPVDEFKKVNITIPHFDKLVHFGMFLILALLIAAKNNPNQKNYTRNLLLFFAVFYGGSIELAQYYITNTRSADWLDWGADIVGIIAGVGLFGLLPTWMHRLLA